MQARLGKSQAAQSLTVGELTALNLLNFCESLDIDFLTRAQIRLK